MVAQRILQLPFAITKGGPRENLALDTTLGKFSLFFYISFKMI